MAVGGQQCPRASAALGPSAESVQDAVEGDCQVVEFALVDGSGDERMPELLQIGGPLLDAATRRRTRRAWFERRLRSVDGSVPERGVRGRGHCRQDVPPSWVALPLSILNAQQDLQRRLRIPQDACDGRLVIGGRGLGFLPRRIDDGQEPRLDADDTVPTPLDGRFDATRRRAPDRTPSAPAVVHRLSAARARVWAGSGSNELVHGSAHRANVVSKERN